MSKPLRYELRDDVAVMTLDDGKANALSHEMLDAIDGALDQAESEAKALLLAGREGRFCAGFELRTMMAGPAAAVKLVSRGAEVLMRLYGFPMPVVVACSGHAMAGGALLLLIGDTRIGAEGDFKIGLNEVSISMPLPHLGRELARDRLDPRQLTAAVIQARIYTPPEAIDAGYLDRVAKPEALASEAMAEAQQLAKLSGPAYAATKTGLRGPQIRHIQESLADDMALLMPPS